MSDEDVPENNQSFIELNAELSKAWPVINELKPAPEDADEWKDKTDKLALLKR
jgi:ferredoxin